MSDDKFAELMSAYLDESASEAQQQELLKQLEASEELCQQAATHAFVERMALESIKKPLSTERVMRALPAGRDSKMALKVMRKTSEYEASKSAKLLRMRRRTFMATAGALAAAAMIVLMVGIWNSPNKLPVVAKVDQMITGTAWLISEGASESRRKLEVGVELRPGDRIEVDDQSGVRISYVGESTQIELMEGTELAFVRAESAGKKSGGKKLRLTQGNLKASVAPQAKDRPLVISTPHADMTVLGTTFTVTVAGDQSKLAVEKGRVRMQSVAGGEGQVVAAKEWATVKSGAQGVLLPGRSLRWYSLRRTNIPKEDRSPTGMAYNESGLRVLGRKGETVYHFKDIKDIKGSNSIPIKLERPLFKTSELALHENLLWGIADEDHNTLHGFDASGKWIRSIKLSKEVVAFLRGNRIWNAFDFGGGFLWLAHYKQLFQIDPSNGTLVNHYKPAFKGKGNIHILICNTDHMYLGTTTKIYRIRPKDGKIMNSYYTKFSGSAARGTKGPGNDLWIYHVTHMQIHQMTTDLSNP